MLSGNKSAKLSLPQIILILCLILSFIPVTALCWTMPGETRQIDEGAVLQEWKDLVEVTGFRWDYPLGIYVRVITTFTYYRWELYGNTEITGPISDINPPSVEQMNLFRDSTEIGDIRLPYDQILLTEDSRYNIDILDILEETRVMHPIDSATGDTLTVEYTVEVGRKLGYVEHLDQTHWLMFTTGGDFRSKLLNVPWDANNEEHRGDDIWAYENGTYIDDFYFTLVDTLWQFAPDIHFTLSEPETIKNWLPGVENIPGGSDNNINVKIALYNPGVQEVQIKLRLWDITWYPGQRTNSIEYEVDNEYAQGLLDTVFNHPTWDDTVSWRRCTDSTFTLQDMIMDSTSISWDTVIYNEGDQGGYFDFYWNSPKEHGNTLELALKSRDFAARGWVTALVRPWSWRELPDTDDCWYAINIYRRFFDHQRFPILPVPIDEELRFYDVSGFQCPFDVGDRMADAWEYEYLMPEMQYQPGHYHDIMQFDAWEDSSSIDRSYYDFNYPQAKFNAKKGDGFLNFEKYRGFYGIHGTSVNPDTIYYTRLNPYKRNIFVLTFTDDSTSSGTYNRRDTLSYFYNISTPESLHVDSSVTLIDLYHLYHNTDEEAYNYEKDVFTDHFNFLIPESDSVEANLYGLNTFTYNLPNHEGLAAVYSNQIYKMDRNTYSLYLRLADDPVTEPKRIWGYVVSSELSDSSGIPGTFHVPSYTYLCQTYLGHIMLHPYAIRDGEYQTDWIKDAQAYTFGHELGHFVGMNHHIQEPWRPPEDFSIMTDADTVYPRGVLSTQWTIYKYGDYSNFRLQK
ncbi:MAG: hypothetical protein P9L92_15210 [Candidatus Electryonea clarkiae]|nr:hypothetical protein [Candidatus Electryonea clarkiae]MDP8287529.1 hypothetical protein [Candidatus Electryonea clarkiae]